MAAYAAEDWDEAAKNFELAAGKGNPHAQFMLAQCCDSRKGVETGFSRHGEWWRKAEKMMPRTLLKLAADGSPDAKKAVRDLEKIKNEDLKIFLGRTKNTP